MMHAIYDRAALIALAPSQRAAYVQTLKVLVPTLNTLLVTITHDEVGGPPYSIDETQVDELFAQDDVSVLVTSSNTPTVARLTERGNVNVQEHGFHIRQRSTS